MRNILLLIPAITSAGLIGSASAAPHSLFDVPSASNVGEWDRFTSQTTYQEWNVFYQPYNVPNVVDADRVDTDGDPNSPPYTFEVTNANLYPGLPASFSNYSPSGKPVSDALVSVAGTQAGTSTVTQTATDTAFIIGSGSPSSGNIYSFAAATAFNVHVWNYDATDAVSTTIWLQVHTEGNVIDVNSVKLVSPVDGLTLLSPEASELLYDGAAGGLGGAAQTRKFTWTVSGNAAGYDIQFASAGSSLSLQNLAVDTAYTTIPEPAAIGLFATVATVVGRRRRRAD